MSVHWLALLLTKCFRTSSPWVVVFDVYSKLPSQILWATLHQVNFKVWTGCAGSRPSLLSVLMLLRQTRIIEIETSICLFIGAWPSCTLQCWPCTCDAHLGARMMISPWKSSIQGSTLSDFVVCWPCVVKFRVCLDCVLSCQCIMVCQICQAQWTCIDLICQHKLQVYGY